MKNIFLLELTLMKHWLNLTFMMLLFSHSTYLVIAQTIHSDIAGPSTWSRELNSDLVSGDLSGSESVRQESIDRLDGYSPSLGVSENFSFSSFHDSKRQYGEMNRPFLRDNSALRGVFLSLRKELEDLHSNRPPSWVTFPSLENIRLLEDALSDSESLISATAPYLSQSHELSLASEHAGYSLLNLERMQNLKQSVFNKLTRILNSSPYHSVVLVADDQPLPKLALKIVDSLLQNGIMEPQQFQDYYSRRETCKNLIRHMIRQYSSDLSQDGFFQSGDIRDYINNHRSLTHVQNLLQVLSLDAQKMIVEEFLRYYLRIFQLYHHRNSNSKKVDRNIASLSRLIGDDSGRQLFMYDIEQEFNARKWEAYDPGEMIFKKIFIYHTIIYQTTYLPETYFSDDFKFQNAELKNYLADIRRMIDIYRTSTRPDMLQLLFIPGPGRAGVIELLEWVFKSQRKIFEPQKFQSYMNMDGQLAYIKSNSLTELEAWKAQIDTVFQKWKKSGGKLYSKFNHFPYRNASLSWALYSIDAESKSLSRQPFLASHSYLRQHLRQKIKKLKLKACRDIVTNSLPLLNEDTKVKRP